MCIAPPKIDTTPPPPAPEAPEPVAEAPVSGLTIRERSRKKNKVSGLTIPRPNIGLPAY